MAFRLVVEEDRQEEDFHSVGPLQVADFPLDPVAEEVEVVVVVEAEVSPSAAPQAAVVASRSVDPEEEEEEEDSRSVALAAPGEDFRLVGAEVEASRLEVAQTALTVNLSPLWRCPSLRIRTANFLSSSILLATSVPPRQA